MFDDDDWVDQMVHADREKKSSVSQETEEEKARQAVRNAAWKRVTDAKSAELQALHKAALAHIARCGRKFRNEREMHAFQAKWKATSPETAEVKAAEAAFKPFEMKY